MKKNIVILTLFLTTLSFSQQMTFDNGKFYVKGNQISSREARSLFATNVKAATLFKQAKAKEGLGGFLLGFGIGLSVGDLAIGVFSDKEYPSAMTYVGAASVLGSIPILSGRKKRYIEAVKAYNADHTQETLGYAKKTFELNAITNQHGFGLQIQF